MRSLTLLAIITAAVTATIVTFNLCSSQGRAADAPSAAEVPSLPEPSTGEDTGGGSEVLTRGPVHEAYATPLEFNPQPGQVIKKEPPAPIEEVPPDQRPEGDNVVWIPGYFSWDDERQDFLWISGVWRNVPPGQTWVAGYWNKVEDGYQWTPGFWTGAKKAEVSYVTESPPSTLEAGPTSPQPSENQFWIPGTWVYQDHYVWQPGYWAVQQPNWVWIPAHWMWTPGGYVFVGGFWDYVPPYRGCLFAPVYFSSVIFTRPHFVWCPGVVINVGFFSGNLFCGPRHHHYYFGDYYAQRYAGLGYRPWFEVGGGRRAGYDPLLTYYRWKNGRSDPNWLAQQKQHYEMLQKNAGDRPPATFAAQKEWMKKNGGAGRNSEVIAATTLAQAAKEPNLAGFKMQNVSRQNRQEMLTQAQALNKFSKERLEIEKQNALPGVAGEGSGRRDTAAAKPTQTLKLPTLGATQTKGGNGQTFSQQAGQGGQTTGRTGGKFNKQLTGVTGQDQQSGPIGKPTLGDKGDKNAETLDQNKAFQGRPFELNKPLDQNKTTDPNQGRNALGAQTGQFAQPSDGQGKPMDDDKTPDQDKSRNLFAPRGGQATGQSGGEKLQGNSGKPTTLVPQGGGGSDKAQGGSGKPTMTAMPQGSEGGGGGDQGSGGKQNVMLPAQGQGSGGSSQRGTNVKAFSTQGGGGQQRNVPSNPPSKKDKDDDQQQQQQRGRNRSDTNSPRTNFSMQRDRSLPLNVGGMATDEKDAMERDISGRSDTEKWVKDALNDKLTDDKNPPSSAPRSTVSKPRSSAGELGGLTLPGGDYDSKAPSTNDKATPQKYSTAPSSGGNGPDARSAGGSPAPAASMPIYRNLMQRGRSLSQPGALASPTGPPGSNLDADARLRKDPVISYGSSPTRNPMIAAPYAAGAQTPTAQAGAAPGTLKAGLGSIQRYTPAQIPTLQRGLGNSYAAPAYDNSDPAARTYDPNRESSNTYGR